MKKDDPLKLLPRPEWSDEDARKRELERASQLLDAESGTQSAAGPDDPEMGEVYGMPASEDDLAPVYGAPEDDRPVRPVYGMPPPRSDLPQRMTVYGGPTIGRRASGGAGVFIAIAAAVVLAGFALWWFLR